MIVEALPPDGGVARAMIDGIEHIRLRDVADAVPGLQPDPRWPTIAFHETAARMFVTQSGVEGVMLHKLPARGRYVPRDQLQPALDYLTSSATIAEAQNRTWAGITANRQRRKNAVPTINIVEISAGTAGKIRQIEASDLPQAIMFTVNEKGLFLRLSDITLTVSGTRTSGAFQSWFAERRDQMAFIPLGSGRPALFLPEILVVDLLGRLSKRKDYNQPMATRLIRHVDALRDRLAAEIATAGLSVPAEPDPVAIVASVMGAGAEALPPICAEKFAPTVAEAEPPRSNSVTQLLDRLYKMGDFLMEQREERRADGQFIAQQIADLRTDLQRQGKALAAMKHQAGEAEGRLETLLTGVEQVLTAKDRQIGHLFGLVQAGNEQVFRLGQELAYRDRQYQQMEGLVVDLGKYCTNLLGSIAELKAIALR